MAVTQGASSMATKTEAIMASCMVVFLRREGSLPLSAT